MTNKVITISRQFGSGGRTIGKKVAEKLGIPYYDKELVDHNLRSFKPSHAFALNGIRQIFDEEHCCCSRVAFPKDMNLP